jgi:hypothetical protein
MYKIYTISVKSLTKETLQFLSLNIDCSVTIHHFTFTYTRLLATNNVLPLGCAA